MEYYRRAADLGNARAINNLGISYFDGRGVEKNESAAFEYFRRAADLGNVAAIYNLGARYDFGRGVEKNESAAFEYYRRAADLGDVNAITGLGDSYNYGIGVEKNFSAGLEYYRRAADLDNVEAIYNLGISYSNGRGVEKNESAGLEYYRRAADLGHAGASVMVGWQYATGEGVKKNTSAAFDWLRLAVVRKRGEKLSEDFAVKIFSEFLINLGVNRNTVSGVLNPDFLGKSEPEEEAYHWLMLGNHYHNGDRFSKTNFQAAFEFYRQASLLGSVEALAMLGYCYRHGIGVEKDTSTAVEFYRRAADLGSPDALNNMGFVHHHGMGVAANLSLAHDLYQQAAQRGSRQADINLAYLHKYSPEFHEGPRTWIDHFNTYTSVTTLFAAVASTAGVDVDSWPGPLQDAVALGIGPRRLLHTSSATASDITPVPIGEESIDYKEIIDSITGFASILLLMRGRWRCLRSVNLSLFVDSMICGTFVTGKTISWFSLQQGTLRSFSLWCACTAAFFAIISNEFERQQRALDHDHAHAA